MEQEVLNNIADMIMESYIAEAMTLRIQKMEMIGANPSDLYRKMLDVFVYDAADKIRKPAMDALNSFIDAAWIARYKAAVAMLTDVDGVNVKETRRAVADKLIEDNDYKF